MGGSGQGGVPAPGGGRGVPLHWVSGLQPPPWRAPCAETEGTLCAEPAGEALASASSGGEQPQDSLTALPAWLMQQPLAIQRQKLQGGDEEITGEILPLGILMNTHSYS